MKFKFHSVVLAGLAVIVEYDADEVFAAYDTRAKFLWFSVEDFSPVEVEPGPVFGSLFQLPGDRLFHATAEEAEQDAHQYLM